MIDRKDAGRIVTYTQHRLDELAKPDVWDRYTRHMESGELKEFKQSCADDEIIIEALKKQIPMKPNYRQHGYYVDYYCPVCGKQQKAPASVYRFRDGSYCEKCGQKIDWGVDA